MAPAHIAHGSNVTYSVQPLRRELPNAPDEIYGVDADDCAIGKDIGKNVEGSPVVGIVEGGNQHQAVCRVEIRIAGRQPLAAEYHRARQRKLDDGELLTIERARVLETL